MALFYPHKQTITIFIVCGIAVMAAWWYASAGTSRLPARDGIPTDAPQAVPTYESSVASKDENWRALFIASTTTLPTRSPSNASSQTSLTVTDTFSRDFFARFISMQQSGLIDNTQFVQSSLEQSVHAAEQAAASAGEYSLQDISVAASPDVIAVRAYGNAVALTFALYGPTADPATVAHAALEGGGSSRLKELDPIIASYERVVSELGTIIVPQPLVGYHLQVMNGSAKMAEASHALRTVEQDPVRALVSIKNYAANQQTIVSALRSMNTYFEAASIQFSPNEAGSMFNKL